MRNPKFRKGLAIFLAFLMMFSVIASVLGSIVANATVSQSDIDALEAQQEELAAERADLQLSIDDLEAEKADAITIKEALDYQNELNRQEIELIDEQIELYEDLVSQKEKELIAAQEVEDAQLERYRTHVREMEETGSYSYIEILFSSTSISELLSNIDMISEIMDADKRIYEDYTAARENTEAVKAEYEETLAALEVKMEELEERKAELEEDIAEAAALIAEIEADIADYEELYAANEAADAAIAAEAANLAAQLAAQEEAARLEAEKNNETYTGVGSTATGTLTWPCPSSTYITSVFGWRIHPIFLTERYHNGIDIAADSGAAIVAADSGTVSIATYSESAGNYVSIYHSDGMMTIYMHMTYYIVSAGEEVTKGQTIGYVGSTGWSTGPHLHFGVSINGSYVDPLSYFSNYTISDSAYDY